VQSAKLKTAFRQENKVKNSKLWNAARVFFSACILAAKGALGNNLVCLA
jgi:hypothetical protein